MKSATTNSYSVATKMQDLKERHQRLAKVASTGDLDAAMALGREVTKDVKLDRASRELFYLLAIILDDKGDHMGAMKLFSELRELFPNHPNFFRSFSIGAKRLATEAADFAKKNPDDPAILNYHEFLLEIYFSPLRVTASAAQQMAKNGQPDKAKEIVSNLLKLSPYDADYIRAALGVAAIIDDLDWQKELIAHTQQLIGAQPWRHELRLLLPPPI